MFWHARTEERAISLTFDLGPCHPYTEQLLEISERERIRATFFMPGKNVVREPSLAAEVASGHVVGNHTYTHPHLTWSRPAKVRDELGRGQEAIYAATGTVPTLFRVPHGWYGPQVISTANELGLRCVGWSVMAWDWNRPPPDTIRHRILRGAGGVTLLHVGQDTDAFPKADRSRTVAAVPRIIDTLKTTATASPPSRSSCPSTWPGPAPDLELVAVGRLFRSPPANPRTGSAVAWRVPVPEARPLSGRSAPPNPPVSPSTPEPQATSVPSGYNPQAQPIRPSDREKSFTANKHKDTQNLPGSSPSGTPRR